MTRATERLAGKVAIVTGASKGIGAAIATELAAEGGRVVVNYAHDEAAAAQVVRHIAAAGGQALAVQADVADPAQVERLFAAAVQHFGAVDVLVNNAGVYAFGPVEAVTVDEFHRHFNTNVLSVFLTSQAASRHFGERGGSIINLVTAGVRLAPPMSALYVASKAAVLSATRVMAKDFGARGIRVNAIAPGATETEGTTAIGFVGSDMARQVAAATPLGRLGRPDDIAPVAAFLASDDARWITGDVIHVAGGMN